MALNKFPENAKVVYEGEIFRVYNREQELFDWNTTTFEWVERKPCITALATDINGDFIILREKQPWMDWYFWVVSWMMEAWETPLDSAKRELSEETGYEFKNIEEVWIMDDAWDWSKMQSLRHLFFASWWEKVWEQNLDAGEIIEVQIVKKEEVIDFIKNNFKGFDRDLILEYYKDKLPK